MSPELSFIVNPTTSGVNPWFKNRVWFLGEVAKTLRLTANIRR